MLYFRNLRGNQLTALPSLNITNVNGLTLNLNGNFLDCSEVKQDLKKFCNKKLQKSTITITHMHTHAFFIVFKGCSTMYQEECDMYSACEGKTCLSLVNDKNEHYIF